MTPLLLALVLAGQIELAQGRKLVFDQDFAKVTRIDSQKWFFDDGPVYNHEAETYTKADHGNARIEGGALVIEARREGKKITSARLESVKAWKNPFVEVVAKVPKGKGTWPAIWMLNDRLRQKNGGVGWPEAGEIDIMENVGYDPPNFHFSLHCGKYNWMKKEQRTKVVSTENPNEYHRFGMDCRPDHIEFYLDGDSGLDITDGSGNSITLTQTGNAAITTVATSVGQITAGSMQFQIGPDAAQAVALSIPDTHANKLGTNAVAGVSLATIDVTTATGATDAIKVIDDAIQQIASIRGQIGSFQSDILASSQSSLQTATQNMTAASSSITDIDMASEMTNYTRLQIMQQAGMSVLAQANTTPKTVLSLLQGG